MAQLGFSTEFPQRIHYLQKETLFQEKIIACLLAKGVKIPDEMINSKFLKPQIIGNVRPKLHTFRKVGARHLKPGSKLHPTINSRTKNSFQFAPVMKVISKEVVEFRRKEIKPGTVQVSINIGGYDFKPVIINGGDFTSISDEVIDMIHNDGFDSPKVFFEWFKASGLYECLHWTNHKYGKDESDS